MNTTKIVFIGAGSVDFGTKMFKDLFSSTELKGSSLTLVDIDKTNLKRMYDLALKMNDVSGAGLKIERTVDRREALKGAGFVVNSIALERCALWKYDFEIPRKYGIRHTLGENGGPGGLFFTMRTIPLIMDIVRDMEEICPDAYFLNFSNPESRIIMALNKYTSIKCVGLCHGLSAAQKDVAKIMGIDIDTIDLWAAGLNHFQWILQIRDKNSGENMYPLLREKEIKFDASFSPLSRKLFRTFGLYPSCSDDHIGEYLPYGWEAGEEGYDFEWDANRRVVQIKEIGEILSGEKAVDDWLVPSGEKAVEVITGILNNKNSVIEAGIVYNQGCISNLPDDLAVEVPIMVNASGAHPFRIGNLPVGISKLLSLQAGAQQMAVEAAVKGSKELALQALLVDPVVNSMEAADKLLEELWEINKAYIRPCL